MIKRNIIKNINNSNPNLYHKKITEEKIHLIKADKDQEKRIRNINKRNRKKIKNTKNKNIDLAHIPQNHPLDKNKKVEISITNRIKEKIEGKIVEDNIKPKNNM